MLGTFFMGVAGDLRKQDGNASRDSRRDSGCPVGGSLVRTRSVVRFSLHHDRLELFLFTVDGMDESTAKPANPARHAANALRSFQPNCISREILQVMPEVR